MNDTNNIIKRGEIRYIHDKSTPDEIQSGRYGIVVSNDKFNKKSQVVMIVYLTTSDTKKANAKNYTTHILVQSQEKIAVALCEQIYTVSKNCIEQCIGTVNEIEMQNIDQAIKFALSIDESSTIKRLQKENHSLENLYNIERHKLDLIKKIIHESES